MSSRYHTDIDQNLKETVVHKHPEYGFVLALLCMALALVVTCAIFSPAPVGSGVSDKMSIVGP